MNLGFGSILHNNIQSKKQFINIFLKLVASDDFIAMFLVHYLCDLYVFPELVHSNSLNLFHKCRSNFDSETSRQLDLSDENKIKYKKGTECKLSPFSLKLTLL